MKHVYSIANDTLNGTCDSSLLEKAIKSSTITAPLEYTRAITTTDYLEAKFTQALTAQEITTLDGIIANHSSDPLIAYKHLVEKAIDFFNTMMVQYAAENITQGITYYGKTKDVADYLMNVMRYGQSGSLYEVVNEIDVLVAAGVPTDLSPFVTTTRLNQMKDEVNTYLGV